MPTNPNDLADLSEIPAAGEVATIDPESAATLDELLKEQTEGEVEEPTTPPPPPAIPPAAPVVETPPTPPDSPASRFVDDAPPVPPPPTPPAPVKDDLDNVPIPPYIKPKTAESFAEVKKIAREKIAVLQKERDDLKAKAEELAAKAAAGLPKEVEEELTTLRQFRSKMDVQADPEFARFDTQVSENNDAIYTKLKAAGFTEETMAKIKGLGGPSEVDWEALAEKIPAGLKRFIDSKLVDNETLVDKKSRAVKAAQEHADEYLKSKSTEEASRVRARAEEAQQHLQGYLPKVPWLSEQAVKADSTPEQRADIERHNKLVGEVNGGIKMILEDETPSMRAIMAVNYAQHLKLKTDFGMLKSRTESEIKDLTTKLAEANSLLERVKNNSTNRLRNTPATDKPDTNPADRFDDNPAFALDAIAKEVLAQ